MTLPAAKTRKPKSCRSCGKDFWPAKSTEKVCSIKCAIEFGRRPENMKAARKAIADRERREIKVRKQRLKSRADHMRECQTVFNAWIRLRDAGQPCISCGTTADVQYCAGHYRTTAAAPELRFEPLNVHLQCNRNCNMGKSGNLMEYRPRLIEKIGMEAVQWLEGPHEPKKYTIEDLQAMKAHFRALIRQMRAAA